MTASTPPVSGEDIEEQLEIAAGRRVPFTQLGDWVALTPGLSPQAKTLYWHLSMHVSITRSDDWVWPSQQVLAEWLGFNRVQSVNRYVDELVAIGALEVELVRYAGGMRQRSRYTVHGTPPEGFAGLVSLKDFYTERKAQLAANPPKKQRRKRAAGGDGVALERKSGVAVERKSEVAPEEQSRDAVQPQLQDAPDPHTKKQDEFERDEGKGDESSSVAGVTTEAGAAGGSEGPGSGKPARKMTARQQAAADKRAARTEQEIARDDLAKKLTEGWFDRLKEATDAPPVGRPFPALMKKLREALDAGYSEREIKLALDACWAYLPGVAVWQKALIAVRSAGTARTAAPAARSFAGGGQRQQRPAMYDDSQWERSTEAPAAKTIEEIDQMFGATG